MRAASLLALTSLLVSCEAAPPAEDDAGRPRTDGGLPAAPRATGLFPAHERELPFAWSRPDVGAPLTDAEVQQATDRYLELLARTDWLDLVDERVHGWPESDPEGRYWYATWWSGAGIERRGGRIRYVHVDIGAENNGLRTPQILEGACYAWLTWRDPRDRHLARRLMRGLSSWHLAMRRSADDDERGLTCRAAYPPDVHDVDRDLDIVYSAARPGPDAGTSQYVHLPDNPFWPDLWVKNTRSKDDMGHLMRAVALIDTCAAGWADPEAEADLIEMRRLYQEWAQRVERHGYGIETYDADLELFTPEGELAHYYTLMGIECGAGFAIPLLSRNDPLGYTCRNGGLGPVPDPSPGISSSSMQILRTHHEAAASLALVTGHDELARELLGGLAARLERLLDTYESGEIPDNARPSDVVQLFLEAAISGVPLTSREVRWLHARIDEAWAGYDTSGPEWHVRDPATPDGDYVLEPSGPGIDLKDIGLFLGLCQGQWVNPAGRAVLDCDRIRASARP